MKFNTLMHSGRFVNPKSLGHGILYINVPILFESDKNISEIIRIYDIVNIKFALKCELVEFALYNIKDLVNNLDLSSILKIIATYSNFEVYQLNSRYRKRELVMVKKLYCYFAKECTGESLSTIGTLIDRDHATVMFHHKDIRDKLPFDKNLMRMVGEISERIDLELNTIKQDVA